MKYSEVGVSGMMTVGDNGEEDEEDEGDRSHLQEGGYMGYSVIVVGYLFEEGWSQANEMVMMKCYPLQQ